MHKIIKSHLDNFVKSYGLDSYGENEQFEMFANFAVITPKVGADFELTDVTTTAADDGIDGVAVLIDEEVVASVDDARSIFKADRKNHDVELLFIQAKRGEQFDLGDFLKFKESVLRFIGDGTFSSSDEVQKDAHEVYELCLRNVPKIRGGKPQITGRFIATGLYRMPSALEQARRRLEKDINDLGYFSNIDVSRLLKNPSFAMIGRLYY